MIIDKNENKGEFNFQMLLNTCRTLSGSQGFYGRLLVELESMNDLERLNLVEELERQNFNDPLDVVMWIEG